MLLGNLGAHLLPAAPSRAAGAVGEEARSGPADVGVGSQGNVCPAF